VSSSEVSSSQPRIDDGAPAPGAAPAQEGVTSRGPRSWARAAKHRLTPEHLAVLVLALLVLVVHDLGYVLSHPYWTDEAWVAATTVFPLSQLPATTSSTPIGWAALMRLFTVGGTQSARLLPLAFAGAAVIVAYWFARRLDWPRREVSVAAGLLAGLGALLVPAMLVRDDLKQYTADACFALLALALTSRLEREWSWRRLAALSVAVWGGMLFSHTVAFMGIAAFGAICLVQLARRQWRRLAEAVVAGGCTAVLMAAVYEAFDARAVLPGLTNSPLFRHYYPPLSDGPRAALTFTVSHINNAHVWFGLGPVWLAAPLFVAGIITVFWLRRPATAIMLAVLWPEMLAISAVRKYPFLDLRTSTFLFVVTAVVAAVGVAGVCSLLRPWLKGGIAIAVAAVAVAGFALAVKPYVRSHLIPNEDVRDQARYVATHAAPSDVILVNLNSNWGFAYYWPVGHPSRRPDAAVFQLYEAYFPSQPRIVVARNRDPAGVDAALAQALARSRQRTCAPIWLIRTHVSAAEGRAWRAALQQQRLTAAPVGDEGLSVIRVGRSQCR
jgi:hypothetical protein